MAETRTPRTVRLPRKETPPRNTEPPKTSTPPTGGASSGGGPGQEPRGDTTPPRASAPRAVPNTKASRMDQQIRDSLLNLYGTIGLAIGGIGQINENPIMVAAGINVTVQAPTVVDTWIELGNQIPGVRRALESMLTGSAIATIAMQHVGMVAPILWAFGLIPAQMGQVFLAPEAQQAGEAFAQSMNAAHAQANGQPAPTPPPAQ